MHPAAGKTIEEARANLGLGETPRGSNDNSIVQEYNRTVDRIGRGAWCEMAQTVWRNRAGAKAVTHQRAYTPWTVQDFQAGKLGSSWHWGTAGMQPGDRVYFDWARPNKVWNNAWAVDHVGIVERVNADGTFYTIEGNYADVVGRHLRDAKYVVGYGRTDWSRLPAYSGGGGTSAPSAPSKPKPTGSSRLSVDGYMGPATIRAWQRAMGTTADGVISRPSDLVRAVQRRLNTKGARLVVDGKGIGSNNGGRYPSTGTTNTVRALQRYLGVKADGYLSSPSDTVKALQRRLNSGSF